MKLRDALGVSASLAAMALISTAAFSRESRNLIRERAGRASEWSRINYRPLECSHKNHRRNAMYDNPENGEYITDWEHFCYHFAYIGCADLIGLNEGQNMYAVNAILDRVCEWNYHNGVRYDSWYLYDMSYRIMRKHYGKIGTIRSLDDIRLNLQQLFGVEG